MVVQWVKIWACYCGIRLIPSHGKSQNNLIRTCPGSGYAPDPAVSAQPHPTTHNTRCTPPIKASQRTLSQPRRPTQHMLSRVP
ncbi:hypothetical protein BPORC_1758 [Bifidobacterium porcinum]|nr:hypothetical protein BPORC_1758 [Bifidobacterium porcinum]